MIVFVPRLNSTETQTTIRIKIDLSNYILRNNIHIFWMTTKGHRNNHLLSWSNIIHCWDANTAAGLKLAARKLMTMQTAMDLPFRIFMPFRLWFSFFFFCSGWFQKETLSVSWMKMMLTDLRIQFATSCPRRSHPELCEFFTDAFGSRRLDTQQHSLVQWAQNMLFVPHDGWG